MRPIRSVNIVFFTGTGGTARIAKSMEEEFIKNGVQVFKTELNGKSINRMTSDLLIILFPVYALNAPKPIDDMIAKLPFGKGQPTAVLSVSGGGEITPNTACRVSTIRGLKRKGYHVYYENMFVMPSNFLITYEDILSAMILQKSTDFSKQVVTEILQGTKRRTKPKFLDRILSKILVIEKIGCKLFGKNLKTNGKCNGCAWCAKQCPRKNIKMKNGRPSFGWRCIICLRCVYGCPKKAIFPGIGKFIVLKEGYNLKKLEDNTKDLTNFPPISDIAKGKALSGVKKYLEEN